MTPALERRLLQATIVIASLVPLIFGGLGVMRGAHWLAHGPVPADLDSHFRYLSGIFLMVGVGFLTCVQRIEARKTRFRLLGAMVIVGGLARALSLALAGIPSPGHQYGLAMELVVVPLLLLWQMRVAHRVAQVPKRRKKFR